MQYKQAHNVSRDYWCYSTYDIVTRMMLVDQMHDAWWSNAGLVPDFKIAIPDLMEGIKEVLTEVKVINCCPSWYNP